MARWGKICSYCMSEGVPRRSFVVALIVGTILNLINHGDALLRRVSARRPRRARDDRARSGGSTYTARRIETESYRV